jgi:HlyD family secretion protein
MGGQDAQAFRERLGKELNLDEGQRAQIEAVFADTRSKIAALTEYRNEYERRKHMLRIRTEGRERIATILRADQRAAYERILGEMSGRASTGRVWVLDGGKPRAIDVRIGVSDGTATEIVAADLAAGADVIIGMAEAPRAPRTQSGPRIAF